MQFRIYAAIGTAVCVGSLTVPAPARAATLHHAVGYPGQVTLRTHLVYANGGSRTLTDPIPWVYESSRHPGRTQRVCGRDLLYRGSVAGSGWTLIRRAPPTCSTIPAGLHRTYLIGGALTAPSTGTLYATAMRITWRDRAGRFLGRILLDYSQARDYACTSNAGCRVAHNTANSFGVVFASAPAPPAPTPTYPQPAPSSRPYNLPASAAVGTVGIYSGQLECPAGENRLTVVPPDVVDAEFFNHPVTDAYADAIFVWNTSTGTWDKYATGATYVSSRGGQSAWRDPTTGQTIGRFLSYAVTPGRFYSVVQVVGEGWQHTTHQLAVPYLAGTSTFNCRAG